MAKLELSRSLSMTPEHAWEHASDFSTLGDWLKMHQGWRSELPDELEARDDARRRRGRQGDA